ncbi:MAG: hypothetical protein WDN29_01135 [Methylovirgula sp.]
MLPPIGRSPAASEPLETISHDIARMSIMPRLPTLGIAIAAGKVVPSRAGFTSAAAPRRSRKSAAAIARTPISESQSIATFKSSSVSWPMSAVTIATTL